MKREHLAFLFAGLAFGTLLGFALFYAVEHRPDLDASETASAMEAPRGPRAPTQASPDASGGGAPMVARINELKRTLEQDPGNLDVLVELAEIYQSVGMWEQAAGFYERAVEAKPGVPELLVNLGLCYRGMGEFDRALAAFDQAHASDPTHWQALFNTVVVAALDVGRFDKAFEALEAMEAIRPRPADLDPAQLKQLRDWLTQSRAENGGEHS